MSLSSFASGTPRAIPLDQHVFTPGQDKHYEVNVLIDTLEDGDALENE